jgi:hypothetical protein
MYQLIITMMYDKCAGAYPENKHTEVEGPVAAGS